MSATAGLSNVEMETRGSSQQSEGTQTPASTRSEEVQKPDNGFHPGPRFYLAFAAIMLLALMVALDGTSISVALPIISRKLKGSAIEAFWTGTAFLLASAVIQPLIASLSHIFGRRPMMFVSLAFFLAGALVAALCKNFTVMIIGRVIQGIGGGGLMALTEILITDLVPLRLRGDWMGLLSVMWSLGSVTGPVIGGAFAEKATWRWIFYINLPFIGLGAPMVWFFLKMNFKESALLDKLRRVDWVGIFLFIASSTSFLVPVTWGGVMYAWDSWHTLVPLLVGIAGIAAFVVWEGYFATETLIRLSIFRETTAKVAYFTTTLHGLILWCILYYLPLYYEAVQGYSPIISGVAIFPGTFTVAPLAAVTGILITKTGQYRYFIIIGWVITTVGGGLLTLLDVHTSIPAWIFETLIVGIGIGILFPALTFAVQASNTEQDMAFAVSMFAFFRTFGQAIGVAIGGVVFQNQMRAKLHKYPAFASQASELAKDATSLVQIIKSMNGHEDLKQEQHDLKQAFSDSVQTVWIMLTCLAGVCLLLSWWIKSFPLDRELETEQGFRHKGSETQVAQDTEKAEMSDANATMTTIA